MFGNSFDNFRKHPFVHRIVLLKFGFSEKSTKICAIFPMVVNVDM